MSQESTPEWFIATTPVREYLQHGDDMPPVAHILFLETVIAGDLQGMANCVEVGEMNPNAGWPLALEVALRENNRVSVEYLLQHGANVYTWMYEYAQTEEMRTLLNNDRNAAAGAAPSGNGAGAE